jgi:hypothetical protein
VRSILDVSKESKGWLVEVLDNIVYSTRRRNRYRARLLLEGYI